MRRRLQLLCPKQHDCIRIKRNLYIILDFHPRFNVQERLFIAFVVHPIIAVHYILYHISSFVFKELIIISI